MNPALAPRSRTCRACREVAAVEHVTALLFSEDLDHLPLRGAADYLRSIGVTGTPGQINGMAKQHRAHVESWIRAGGALAPMQGDGGVVRVPPPSGPTRWLDANQAAIDLGNEALRDLASRLAGGTMETHEVIALAKLGVGAASTRGSMEQRGKALTGIDRLLQLAAGGVGDEAPEDAGG